MMPSIRTKSIYESIMHRQRMLEAKKQHDRVENKKFFQDSDVRTRQEKRWTSETSFNNSMMANLLPDRETVFNKLEARKSKLRFLLQKEAGFYKKAINQSPRSRDCTYASLRDRIDETLHNNKCTTSENEQISALRSFVNRSPNEIDKKSDSMNRQAESAMSGSETPDAIESKSVVYDSHKSDERRHDIALQQNMDELKQFERESKELDTVEKEVLEGQSLLHRLATERREINETRLQRRFGKTLLRQHSAALIRRSRQVQTEIADDLAWIDRLLALEGEQDEDEGGEGLRNHIIAVKEMFEEDLRHEARREKDMDNMLASEAAELARKRDQEWKYQEDARARLLNEVLFMCQDRADSRLQALKQIKSERAEFHEALRREINAAELQRKPPFQKEHISSENCDKVAEIEGVNRRRSHAEAVFEEKLRKEAEKLSVSVDELEKVASGMKSDKAPFTGNRHKTQLW